MRGSGKRKKRGPQALRNLKLWSFVGIGYDGVCPEGNRKKEEVDQGKKHYMEVASEGLYHNVTAPLIKEREEGKRSQMKKLDTLGFLMIRSNPLTRGGPNQNETWICVKNMIAWQVGFTRKRKKVAK